MVCLELRCFASCHKCQLHRLFVLLCVMFSLARMNNCGSVLIYNWDIHLNLEFQRLFFPQGSLDSRESTGSGAGRPKSRAQVPWIDSVSLWS